MLKKIRTAFSSVTKYHFLVLQLQSVSDVSPKIPIVVVRYSIAKQCPRETLVKIKGEAKDWTKRWLRGDVCYVAWVDMEPVAYIWISHGEWHLEEKDNGYLLPQKCAFLYDARTRESWRGNGVYQALMSKSAGDLASSGYRDLCLLVNDRDPVAQHGPEKLGFQRTGDCIYVYRFLRVFKFRRDRLTSLANASGKRKELAPQS